MKRKIKVNISVRKVQNNFGRRKQALSLIVWLGYVFFYFFIFQFGMTYVLGMFWVETMKLYSLIFKTRPIVTIPLNKYVS